MATEQRLTWGGNLTAQQEADKAWNEFRGKAAAKKYLAKVNSPPKKPSKGQRRRLRKLRRMGQVPPAFQEPRRRKRIVYRDYIQSKAWKKRRERYYDDHGKQCEVCGSTVSIQLHHRHYRTLGREEDKDLQAVCRGCHENHHEQEGKTMDPMTREFLSLNL